MRFINLFLFIFLVGCSSNENIVNSNALNIEGNIYKLKGEVFNGKVLDALKNGRETKSFRCINGKIEGEYLEYYSTGSIKKRNNYKDGLLEGVSEYYNKDGSVYLRQTYKKGIPNGYFKKTHYDGSNEGYYKNGLQNGLWIYRYLNQKLKAKGIFENGDESSLGKSGVPFNGRVGEWVFYNEDGTTIGARYLYKNNSEIAEGFEYYKNGKIHSKGTFNKRTNEAISWVEFDENGKVISKHP
jgi:antitoxin component YwqK of YwqJK toxin-antitoxin module